MNYNRTQLIRFRKMTQEQNENINKETETIKKNKSEYRRGEATSGYYRWRSWVKWAMVVKRYKIAVTRQMSLTDVMYSMKIC